MFEFFRKRKTSIPCTPNWLVFYFDGEAVIFAKRGMGKNGINTDVLLDERMHLESADSLLEKLNQKLQELPTTIPDSLKGQQEVHKVLGSRTWSEFYKKVVVLHLLNDRHRVSLSYGTNELETTIHFDGIADCAVWLTANAKSVWLAKVKGVFET